MLSGQFRQFQTPTNQPLPPSLPPSLPPYLIVYARSTSPLDNVVRTVVAVGSQSIVDLKEGGREGGREGWEDEYKKMVKRNLTIISDKYVNPPTSPSLPPSLPPSSSCPPHRARHSDTHISPLPTHFISNPLLSPTPPSLSPSLPPSLLPYHNSFPTYSSHSNSGRNTSDPASAAACNQARPQEPGQEQVLLPPLLPCFLPRSLPLHWRAPRPRRRYRRKWSIG